MSEQPEKVLDIQPALDALGDENCAILLLTGALLGSLVDQTGGLTSDNPIAMLAFRLTYAGYAGALAHGYTHTRGSDGTLEPIRDTLAELRQDPVDPWILDKIDMSAQIGALLKRGIPEGGLDA
jgi:hypothetical protein